METGLTKNQVISLLTRSPHGELNAYAPIGKQAANDDPNFFAHLVAWNARKGAIRDAKVALPILALTSEAGYADAELRDNALAHVASLDPRNMVRAVRFAKTAEAHGRRTAISRIVERYLSTLEANPGRFTRVALQHRGSLLELYTLLHVKPGQIAKDILFDRKKVGVFADVANLKNMSPTEAAGVIVGKRIPFLVVQGALGAKLKDPELLQALITVMSPTELVTNSKKLVQLGVNESPALRATFEKALAEAAQSNRTSGSTLKATRAAEAVGGVVGEKLLGLQEKQVDKLGMKGDWLVLADKSSSMTEAIEIARQVADVLARAAEGAVHLVFFNTAPTYYNVTGKTLDEISAITKREVANGGTSIGVGLQYALEKSLVVDGIAVVSDGAENSAPMFAPQYKKLCESLGKEIPVYLYWMKCHQPSKYNNDPDTMATNCLEADVSLQTFDLRKGVDFYSLPNIIATMRTNRFGLVDEIMETPLLRLADVFKQAA